MGTKKWHFFSDQEKTFFRPFFRPKNSENFQKKWKIWKIWKIAKNGQNFKNFVNCPKSFRNWVKPILGTKNDIFREFFFAHFSDQKTEKKKKKKNFFKNEKFEKLPKMAQILKIL